MSRVSQLNENHKHLIKDFDRYLDSDCGVKYESRLRIRTAVNHVSNYMKENGIVNESIYEIKNIYALEKACIKAMKLQSFHDIPSKQTLKLAMDYYCHFAARQKWCKQSHKGIYLR